MWCWSQVSEGGGMWSAGCGTWEVWGDYVLLVTGERPRRNVVCEVRKVCDVGARGLAPCVS